MVKSLLKPEIDYEENQGLDQFDMNYKTSQYDAELLGHDVIMALGKKRNFHLEKHNVIYYVK